MDSVLRLHREVTGSRTAQKQEAVGFSLLLHQSCLNLAFSSQASTAWFVIGSISDLFFKVTLLLKHDFIAPAVLGCPNVLGKPHSLWTVLLFFFPNRKSSLLPQLKKATAEYLFNTALVLKRASVNLTEQHPII